MHTIDIDTQKDNLIDAHRDLDTQIDNLIDTWRFRYIDGQRNIHRQIEHANILANEKYDLILLKTNTQTFSANTQLRI